MYYNDTGKWVYQSNYSAMPLRENAEVGFQFLVTTEEPVTTLSAEQAAQIHSEGEVVETNKVVRNEAYKPGYVFETPQGQVLSTENQAALYELARQNPEKILLAALGNFDSALDPSNRPENLIVVGLYTSSFTLPGADIYIDPRIAAGDDSQRFHIESSSAATAHTTEFLSQANIQFSRGSDLKKYFLEHAKDLSTTKDVDENNEYIFHSVPVIQFEMSK